MNFGWKKDREDLRDFDARRLIIAEFPLPKTFLIDAKPMIYNQGSEPSCVGFSCAGAKTDEEFLQLKRRYAFDGSWLYKECKKVDGYPYEEGTEPRFALKIMAKFFKRKSWFFRPDAKYRIRSYYRIPANSTDNFVKQIIYQYGTIIAGSWWFDSWMDKFAVFPKPDVAVGGHAYRVMGWDEYGFVVANSWGKSLWGIDGVATMSYGMFLDVLKESDCWKLIDL